MDGRVKENKEGRKGQEEKERNYKEKSKHSYTPHICNSDFVCNFVKVFGQNTGSLTTVVSILIFNDFKRSSKVDKPFNAANVQHGQL